MDDLDGWLSILTAETMADVERVIGRYPWSEPIFRKRQTIRLTLNQRRFISGAVFCIRPEVLQPKASSDPDQQDLYFPVHHKVLAAL